MAKQARTTPKRRRKRGAPFWRSRTFLIVAIVAAALALLAGGALAVRSAVTAGAERSRANALALARQYLERGEFGSAQGILDDLLLRDAGDVRARALLDEVIAAKQAAANAARSQELAAQQAAARAEQDRLAENLAEIGKSLKGSTERVTERIVIQPPADDAAAKATAAEKERQKKIQDLLARGATLFNDGRYADAAKAFEEALALDAENAQALAFLGRSRYKANPNDAEALQKAAEYSNRAIVKDPSLYLPHQTLGEIYEDRKLYDEAAREFKSASRLNPSDPELLYALGRVQYIQKQYAEARDSFDACLKIKPDHVNANYRRGLTLRQLGQTDRAIDSLTRATNLKRDFTEAWYWLGVLQQEKGNLAAAAESLKKASELAPANVDYLRKLGSIQSLRGDYAAADASFTRALALDIRHPATNLNLATVRLKLNKAQEALPIAQKAAELAPESAEAGYTLGLAHEKLGSLDEAIRWYGEAIQRDPKFTPALVNLGGIYDTQGFPDRALPLLLSAAEVEPSSYEVNNNLGNVYLHKQLYPDAIARFRKALAAKPDARQTRYNIGLAYVETGQLADAKQVLGELIKLDATWWDAYLVLARVFIRESNQADARKLLETLLARNPKYERRGEAQELLDQMK